MSYGMVICATCKREIHQDGPDRTWQHCESKTSLCDGAAKVFASKDRSEVMGQWCGADDVEWPEQLLGIKQFK